MILGFKIKLICQEGGNKMNKLYKKYLLLTMMTASLYGISNIAAGIHLSNEIGRFDYEQNAQYDIWWMVRNRTGESISKGRFSAISGDNNASWTYVSLNSSQNSTTAQLGPANSSGTGFTFSFDYNGFKWSGNSNGSCGVLIYDVKTSVDDPIIFDIVKNGNNPDLKINWPKKTGGETCSLKNAFTKGEALPMSNNP